ncbi:tyrosine-type recombinase/integrase [Rhodococcus koreensis]|uniref:Site-specific recombinase XerD n=1 Tax=Rhodococcus koreensis TaxID=99653 RepID=A0A1H4KWV6_9NOCA|nr:tyrosine-type recombinase/integrase [Rhodococcus koreensis]SEB62598.1 Site-specific recombinase XerD [Rhodococcus koreensis]
MQWDPCLVRSSEDAGVSLGHPDVDDYLRFVATRARRNTLLATAFDLKVFFAVVAKDPNAVTRRDVLAFIEAQRAPRRGPGVVRLEDGEAGLSARTVKRRLTSVSGLFEYLIVRGDAGIAQNPVPRGLSTRRAGTRTRTVPLLRTPRTLPRVLSPSDVDAVTAVLRTHRDTAMIEAMLLGALRRSEVLGLTLDDIRVGEKRVFIADGKGGHQRIVPVSERFFQTLARYLDEERPDTDTNRVFLVLKGPRRGKPLSAAGLEEIIRGLRRRSGVAFTCHQLRHTCLTRLREAGMALEAVQAQAGHRSIESTRIYLHLASGWLDEEYRRALTALDIPTAEGTR